MKELKTENIKKVNNILGVENTRTTIKNTRFLVKQFTTDFKKNRKYINKDIILKNNLEYLKQNYDCYFIKDDEKEIFIDIKKRPIKGGKFEYTAIGYEFINFLKVNNLKTEITI